MMELLEVDKEPLDAVDDPFLYEGKLTDIEMRKMEIEHMKLMLEEVKLMFEEENPNIDTSFPTPVPIEESKEMAISSV